MPCQRAKITRHVAAPVGKFTAPSRRFEHIHLDIIAMPSSEGKRYCLTCVDRFTRWPEAFPIKDQEAGTVARAFYEGWICRFGTPLQVTTDQGRQFESHLFRQLNELTGTTHLKTAVYHPQANDMVERFHRQLKAAIKCRASSKWTQVLPTILLGIRAAWREDLRTTAAELLYGETLRLPGQFLTQQPKKHPNDCANFVKELHRRFDDLRPIDGTRHGETHPFVFKDLKTANQVFVRREGAMLQPPYDGPFAVMNRDDENFTIRVHGKNITVSIDRVKPAYLLSESLIDAGETTNNQQQHTQTHPTATPACSQGNTNNDREQDRNPPIPQQRTGMVTRAGRRIRAPDRFQAGLK